MQSERLQPFLEQRLAWGTVRSLAQATNQTTLARAMDRALKEGGRFNERLTQLAEKEITSALLEGASG